MTTTTASETTVNEIAAGIYRISTPVPPSAMPGGFTFNQFLIVDDAAAAVPHRDAAPVPGRARGGRRGSSTRPTLRWIGFSHVEADECGALTDWLAIAPQRAAGLQPGGGR